MLELRPEMLGGILLFNVQVKEHCASTCKVCIDYSVGIHNRLKRDELPYLIIDFQDTKDFCRVFLEEIVHLRKRIRMPMYLVGVMPRVEQFFKEYSLVGQAKIFLDPEEAIIDLKKTYSEIVHNADFSRLSLDESIKVSKVRMQHRVGGADAAPAFPDRVEL